jgi:ribosome biogenesis GTPase
VTAAANSNHPELEPLGWSAWFDERVTCTSTHGVARVAAVDRDLLLLIDDTGAFRARLAGRLLHQYERAQEPPDERPCVGDWVCVSREADDAMGLVHGRLPRRTVLRRTAPGDAHTVQAIAANVDTVIVVMSCHFDFNVNRLERYLVMIADGGAEPCVLLTKSDLVTPETLAAQVASIRAAGLAVPVWTMSALSGEGVAAFEQMLVTGRSYCFVGSSGVGKSTIINHLVGRAQLATGAVSGTGEGRHTTVRRELIPLAGGALVIDNPGMREFGIMTDDAQLVDSFADIAALADHCRFADCRHVAEPGCAVLAAVNDGVVDRAHFEHFLALRKEAAFASLSHAERRQKDRTLGRMYRAVSRDLSDT